MYCLDAMEKFEAMGEAQMSEVVMEIVLLGRQGLDVNDSSRKYQLRSMAGDFSGLHLVSMMYVGFRRLRSEADIGFDLSREYEVARGMRGAG